MTFLLEAHGLSKSYVAGHGRCWARVQVLTGLSLAVAEGERVVILGGRGAGKTTLLHCLTGLRRPDAGTVRWSMRLGTPYTVCAEPGALHSARRTALVELPADGWRAGAWLEALHARHGSGAGWLVLSARLAPLLPLCHRVLELHEGALRPVAAASPARVAEHRAGTLASSHDRPAHSLAVQDHLAAHPAGAWHPAHRR